MTAKCTVVSRDVMITSMYGNKNKRLAVSKNTIKFSPFLCFKGWKYKTRLKAFSLRPRANPTFEIKLTIISNNSDFETC